DGRWKLQLPHVYRTLGGRPGGHGGTPAKYEQVRIKRPELYDLSADVGESRDVASEHPEGVARLPAVAGRARDGLGDAPTPRRRPHGADRPQRPPPGPGGPGRGSALKPGGPDVLTLWSNSP